MDLEKQPTRDELIKLGFEKVSDNIYQTYFGKNKLIYDFEDNDLIIRESILLKALIPKPTKASINKTLKDLEIEMFDWGSIVENDEIKTHIIDEGKSFEHDYKKLGFIEEAIFVGYYISATENIDSSFLEGNHCEKCYSQLPTSIKSDILTLGIDNEAVQANIKDWIKNVYFNQNDAIH